MATLDYPVDTVEMDYRSKVALNHLYRSVVDEAGRTTTENVQTPTWDHIGEQILGTLVMYAGVYLLSLCIERFYAKNPACRRFATYIKNYMGYASKATHNLWKRSVLYYLLMITSTMAFVSFVMKSYHLNDEATKELDVLSGLYFLVVFCLEWTMADFSSEYLTRPWTVLDMLTFIPQLMTAAVPYSTFKESWISIEHLRVLFVYQAWDLLKNIDDPLVMRLSDSTQRLLDISLRFVLMVFVFAGTMWDLEVLGDIEWFQDEYVFNGDTPLSFFQMCYYTLVTISTVGYGDFAPVSVFGRLFAVVIIAGGVAMFSILLNEITESNHKEASGAGEYSKVVHQKKHIVVLGGAVNQFNKEVVGGFVKQICSCGAMESDIPDIVLFGTHPREGDTLPVLGEMQCKRRVTYLHGSFDNEKDWGRARLSEAIGVYILPEVEVTDTKMEDEVNIICTKTMLAGVGKGTYVRLLLHRPESLVVAAKIGIPEGMCQVWTDISQMILAESINVKGFSTLLTNMMTLNTPELSTVSSISDLAASAGDWVKEYHVGAQQSVFTVTLPPQYDAVDCASLKQLLYRNHGAVLMGAVVGNTPMLVTSGVKLFKGDVVYILGNPQLKEAFGDSPKEMEPAQLAALRPSGMRSRMLYAEWMMSIGSNASTSAEDGDQLPASAKAVGTTEDTNIGMIQPIPKREQVKPEKAQHTKRQYLGRWPVKSAGLRSRSLAETLVQYQQEAERQKAEKLSNKQVLNDIAASQHVRKKHTMIYADSLRSVTFQKQLLGLCLQIGGSGKTCTQIIVVSDDEVPDMISNMLPGTLFIRGNADNSALMEELSLQSAHRVILLSSTLDSSAELYPDRRTIVSLALIEDYINSRQQAYRPQVVLDLYRRGSLLNVHPPASGFRRKWMYPDQLAKDQVAEEQYVPGGEHGLMWHFMRVSGRALSKSRYSCMYAYDYFNPGVMMMMLDGLAYNHMFCDDPSANHRIVAMRIPIAWVDYNYGKLFAALHRTGATLLGLYRVVGTGGSATGYVCTNPARTATFTFGDLAYVLAPHAWLAIHEHLINPGNVMAACVIQRAWRRSRGRGNSSTPIMLSPKANSKRLGKAGDDTQAAAANPPRSAAMSQLAKGYAMSSREPPAAAPLPSAHHSPAAAPLPSAHHSHDEYPLPSTDNSDDEYPEIFSESSAVSQERAPIQPSMVKTPFALRPNLPHREQLEVLEGYLRTSDLGSDRSNSFSHRM